MPSIRQLANDLNLNTKTVAKAYRLLERDSVIQTRGYRGTFVHPDEARVMRNLSPTRTAVLKPRRVTDLVSPAFLGLAAATYFAFVLLVVYVRQFDFPWFGGYANVGIITIGNAFLATILLRQIYGRKLDPHQATEDRLKSLETIAHVCVFVSIAATVFVGLNIGLAAFDQRALQPAAQSVYFQLLALASFRVYLVPHSNFDVYEAGSVAV